MDAPPHPVIELLSTLAPPAAPAPAADVQPFLRIRPPAGSDDTPPVLSFQRKRRVDLPWETILGSSAASGETSIAAIRAYFESSWGLGDIDKATLPLVVDGEPARIKALQTAGRSADGKAQPLAMYRAQVGAAADDDAADGAAAQTVNAGLVVQHGTSGRWYLMVSRTGEPLSLDGVTSPKAYDALWTQQVDGVELVFDSAESAQLGATQFSEVDLRPALIHRTFNELLIQRRFADTVSDSAAKATAGAVEKITSTTLDIDELQRLQTKSFQLQSQAYEAQRRLDRLVSQAADLGYYLFLEAREFTFPGGAKTKVAAGEIYTQYRRTATWVTTHQRNVKVETGWWVFKGSKTVRQPYTKTNAKVVTDYRKVDTTRDPLVEAVANRRASGMAVYVFEQGPTGFITGDGTPLREVMTQCDRNEAFRRRCVVMLPVVEESLTGARVLTKYSVFERPLPGISPSALPRFSLLESLSYRTAWQACQLGELVSTINLAPGEERTVTMTRAFDRETTVTRSSTSIFDLSRADSSDLATEMENQARQESERSSQMNVSATGRASYGVFSAEASASAGSSTSLKSFAQSIGKVARKASQAVNQQQREEVSTSSSAKTSVSSKDESNATLRNINQGRTLNLLFHRLNNHYRGGIYLDGLQFEVVPSTEIIGGSGVFEALRFSLDEVPQLLEQFQQERLPFDIVPDDEGGVAFLTRVVDGMKSLLETEYMGPDRATMAGAAGAPRAARARGSAMPPDADGTRSVGLLTLGPAPASASAPAPLRSARAPARQGAAADGHDAIDGFIARLKAATVDSRTPIRRDELIMASGGLYMDAVVGAQASTEPYSEAMRAQEIRLRDAEVRKTLAEAAYQMALAQGVAQGAQVGEAGNPIVAVVPDATRKSLHVQARDPLPAGQWDLLVDGQRKATARVSAAGSTADATAAVYRWSRAQAWLTDEDLASRITLVERRTRQLLVYEG